MGVICKYKYDSSIYADLIPEFNSGYSGYTITDEVEGNIITRTIESDKLPTLMRFGSNLDAYVEGSEVALLEVLDMNTSGLTSCLYMFRLCKNLTSITCEWDTSNVTNMYAMFHCCNKLTTLDVSNFNTSNVTTMRFMFYDCNNLTTLDVSNWDTSNIDTMQYLFSDCTNLTTLDVSNFDTSNVINMSYMFNNCYNLTSLDVSNFDTSKVNNMTNMFNGCINLTSLDVSDFDTTNVTRMNYMFANCLSLTSLDVSNFNTTEVTMMNNMFQNCSNLTNLDLSNFDTSNVTNTADMFTNTNSLEVITMFNNDIDTINVVGNLTSATIYVDESLDQSQYTGTAPLKVYKEEKLEIKLNSPLLEEDTIEVVDGKICHVHRWDKVVLDGSEGWEVDMTTSNIILYTKYINPITKYDILHNYMNISYLICDTFEVTEIYTSNKNTGIALLIIPSNGKGYVRIRLKENNTIEHLKEILQNNPATVIYKLATPYYEDITPLQSSIVLKTFLESSMTIDTILPIETKLSYRTNVPSISTLSTRATELAESDNVIHNLMNIIDDEVDE